VDVMSECQIVVDKFLEQGGIVVVVALFIVERLVRYRYERISIESRRADRQTD